MPSTPPELANRLSPDFAASPASLEGQSVTGLLRAWGSGDAQASDSLVRLVYAELRRQARLALRREGAGHTLQPTALVHEAWLRLGDQHDARWESRTQFFAVAAQIMRRILVDHARRRHAVKRGAAPAHVTLGAVDREGHAAGLSSTTPPSLDPVDLLALDDALARLATMDPQKARLVELRYFAGLSMPETAEAAESTAPLRRFFLFFSESFPSASS